MSLMQIGGEPLGCWVLTGERCGDGVIEMMANRWLLVPLLSAFAVHPGPAGAMGRIADALNFCGAGRNKNIRAACDAACEAGIFARETFCREFTPAGTPLRAACWQISRESIQYCHNWCAWWF